jgi:outer membrane beta-barrel protein
MKTLRGPALDKGHFMNIRLRTRLPLLIALTVTLAPLAAQAQRKSPLADAPAIRKRLELRSSRFELGAGFGSTLNQDFFHTVFADVKLGFHVFDWFSVSGFADFAVANIATGFQDRLVGSDGSLPPAADPNAPRDPTRAEATASMSKINQMLGLQLEFTPFTGKFAMFGKLFAHYDFYAFVGPGFINVAPANSGLTSCDSAVNVKSCAVSGIKPGANVGVGFHTFFNQWFGLNVELRDIVAQLNPSGRDVNGDGVANADDLTWSSTYSVLLNVVAFLPPNADISP